MDIADPSTEVWSIEGPMVDALVAAGATSMYVCALTPGNSAVIECELRTLDLIMSGRGCSRQTSYGRYGPLIALSVYSNN